MESKRLHYIDWLRVAVVLTLIPFHASLTYLRYGVVYIKEPVAGPAALPFLAVSVPLGDFVMTLMFFLAGVAAFYSFKKRGSASFIGERARKLMLPFGLGYLLLCPGTAYFKALYEGYQGNFISFLPAFFSLQHVHYLGYGHLWFLLYLFVFTLVCVPLFQRWQRDESGFQRIGAYLSQGNRLLLPIGFIIVLEACLRPFFSAAPFSIIGDWANDALYLSVFIFGYVYAADMRLQDKVKGYFKISLAAAVLSLATLFYVNIHSQVFYSNAIYLTVLWVLAKGVYECFGIIFLLNAGRICFNRRGRALGYLSGASYTYYVFHFLPVTFFTWLFLGLNIHIFVKFLLTVVLSYLTVFLVYEFWWRVSAFKPHMVQQSR